MLCFRSWHVLLFEITVTERLPLVFRVCFRGAEAHDAEIVDDAFCHAYLKGRRVVQQDDFCVASLPWRCYLLDMLCKFT